MLILQMEENTHYFWHIVLFISKGKNAVETPPPQRICAVYGEGAMTDRTCQKWFAKLRTRDFSLDQAPWSGRPVEVDSDQIKTLNKNNQHYTMWETADILKISKPT